MFEFFKQFLDPKNRYEKERRMAVSDAVQDRMKLATSKKTHPEILFYLAEKDSEAKVRKAVAVNKSTPQQVSPVLAQDKDIDVRLALAERLVRLLPDLSQDKQTQIYAFAVQALAALALDEVLKVRLALSSALKDYALAPPKIVGQLARDIEREVSEPILRFCSALSDADLIDILKGHPASWVVQAIAMREKLSEAIAEAVIDTKDPPGGAKLIENEGANISLTLLERIIDMARKLPEWQKPVALRKNLPSNLARQLASFVEPSVRDILSRRDDFDEDTVNEITSHVRRRLDQDVLSGYDDPQAQAMQMHQKGTLNEEAIADALGLRKIDFVLAALALKTGASVDDIRKIVGLRAPKPLVSVVWRAGFSMRLALTLQKDLAHIDPSELLYPKGGTDFPLSQADMSWQLDFLGLDAKAPRR